MPPAHFDVAKNASGRKRYFQRGLLLLVFGVAILPTAGCLSGGLGLGGGPGVDKEFVSGSIPVYPMLQTDDDIIKSAVSEANTKKGSFQNIPWTNVGSGNSGIVSYVGERRTVTEICREFITSKHSYDGIAQYHGNICRTRMGKTWTLESIEEQD